MAYKYTAYYYLKNGKTDSKEIVTGYNLRTASDDQKWYVHNKLPVRDILEYDIYDSKGGSGHSRKVGREEREVGLADQKEKRQ